jgi:hypothetical protein
VAAWLVIRASWPPPTMPTTGGAGAEVAGATESVTHRTLRDRRLGQHTTHVARL